MSNACPSRGHRGRENLKLKIGTAPSGREKSLALLDKLRSVRFQPLIPVNWTFSIFLGHFYLKAPSTQSPENQKKRALTGNPVKAR
jgi:hypothetical protein